jgi:hypothetical protein
MHCEICTTVLDQREERVCIYCSAMHDEEEQALHDLIRWQYECIKQLENA